jgi:beta-xylosidase
MYAEDRPDMHTFNYHDQTSMDGATMDSEVHKVFTLIWHLAFKIPFVYHPFARAAFGSRPSTSIFVRIGWRSLTPG